MKSRIDPTYAAERLEYLFGKNKRLPVNEVQKRLRNWTLLTGKDNKEEM